MTPTVDCNNCRHRNVSPSVFPCNKCRQWDSDDVQWQPIIDWKAVAKYLWRMRCKTECYNAVAEIIEERKTR